jgi:preprotein translocase subunit YajC
VPAYLLIFVTVGLMWLLLIRPQQRRLREHQRLVASLEAGAAVLTQGGLYGTITAIDGDVAELEVAPGVVVRVAKASVAVLVEPRRPDTPSDIDNQDDDESVDNRADESVDNRADEQNAES